MNTKKKPPGLLQVMRERMRLEHMSMFTEKNYVHWVRSGNGNTCFHHTNAPLTVQFLLGHKSVKTTMIYTHVTREKVGELSL